MAKLGSYRELVVWQKAMLLAERVYRLTESFPSSERFGLTSQMRRAAVSILSNVAEGHNRRSRGSYASHVCIALGSQAELEAQIELSRRLGYCDVSQADPVLELLAEIGRMLHGLVRALEKRPTSA